MILKIQLRPLTLALSPEDAEYGGEVLAGERGLRCAADAAYANDQSNVESNSANEPGRSLTLEDAKDGGALLAGERELRCAAVAAYLHNHQTSNQIRRASKYIHRHSHLVTMRLISDLW